MSKAVWAFANLKKKTTLILVAEITWQLYAVPHFSNKNIYCM